jgi:hypothetical protein
VSLRDPIAFGAALIIFDRRCARCLFSPVRRATRIDRIRALRI